MNDDYLWDRTGEPDPEVEHLEQVLGKYRYQAKPLSPTLQSRLSERRGGWMRFAAVAAAVLIALAAFLIYKVQNKSVTTQSQANKTAPSTEGRKETPETVPPVNEQPAKPTVATGPRREERRPIHRKSSKDTTVVPVPFSDSNVVAERQPLINPFIDAETARHIERSQLLLRAFRNTKDTAAQAIPEIAYERQRSRGLLSRNILLRRDAEAKGNLPVEELLGSLEPFLLDIANLPDKPSNDDVRSIKDRMHKKEIISALQVYSAPTLARVF
jgi:hypothetical protein